MSRAWVDPAPHKSRFVRVNGVRLNYLDWGGRGPWLIFIHGLTGTPHNFDDLVPHFTDRFRVIAYARRCHGLSEVKGHCDERTVTEDLRCLMDALKVEHAHLVGHSYGGTELTGMASAHPSRVDRIVYIDAGYDWADPLWGEAMAAWPFDLEVPESARQSMAAYLEWAKTGTDPKSVRAKWFEPTVRESVIVQRDGSVKPRQDVAGLERLVKDMLGNRRRDYSKVRCPALAIYASEFADGTHVPAANRQKVRAWEKKYPTPLRAKGIAGIRSELRNVRIVRVRANHGDIVVTSKPPVAKLMQDFLIASTLSRRSD